MYTIPWKYTSSQALLLQTHLKLMAYTIKLHTIWFTFPVNPNTPYIHSTDEERKQRRKCWDLFFKFFWFDFDFSFSFNLSPLGAFIISFQFFSVFPSPTELHENFIMRRKIDEPASQLSSSFRRTCRNCRVQPLRRDQSMKNKAKTVVRPLYFDLLFRGLICGMVVVVLYAGAGYSLYLCI